MANPHSADTPHWEAAFEHYYRDDVISAFAEADQHGVGDGAELLRWYRIIEAEALTRGRSQVMQVAPWLTVEYVPSETLGLEKVLAARAFEACTAAGDRFGWVHAEETRLTILAEATDAPWATNPYGYCVAKDPYEKICLPNYLVDDLEEFVQAVSHEYAHVITTNLSEGLAPRWLEEAVSVLVEHRFDGDCWKGFCTGHTPWLNPGQLESALIDRHEDDGTKQSIWTAYQQAGWIGRFLAEIYGEKRLTHILSEVANESHSVNFGRLLRGRERTEDSIRRVLQCSTDELFDRAKGWIQSVRVEDV
jgi:hypothetical protein